MKELFNGKDAYVIINYNNRTHLIRHNVTRAFEDDYKCGSLDTKQITIFDTQPHHYYTITTGLYKSVPLFLFPKRITRQLSDIHTDRR